VPKEKIDPNAEVKSAYHYYQRLSEVLGKARKDLNTKDVHDLRYRVACSDFDRALLTAEVELLRTIRDHHGEEVLVMYDFGRLTLIKAEDESD
jgi:hypothetical protein